MHKFNISDIYNIDWQPAVNQLPHAISYILQRLEKPAWQSYAVVDRNRIGELESVIADWDLIVRKPRHPQLGELAAAGRDGEVWILEAGPTSLAVKLFKPDAYMHGLEQAQALEVINSSEQLANAGLRSPQVYLADPGLIVMESVETLVPIASYIATLGEQDQLGLINRIDKLQLLLAQSLIEAGIVRELDHLLSEPANEYLEGTAAERAAQRLHMGSAKGRDHLFVNPNFDPVEIVVIDPVK